MGVIPKGRETKITPNCMSIDRNFNNENLHQAWMVV
jgi:hypothetical protein